MDASRHLMLLVLPVFVLASLCEAAYLHVRRVGRYDWREVGSSLLIALGQRAVGAATAGVVFGVLTHAWALRVWTVPMDKAWSWALLLLAVEFAYYWQHRCSHEIRWFWATHSVHHSSRTFCLANADRLGWTGQLSGNVLFLVPLSLLGFPPAYLAGALVGNLFYQFWLHTEIIGRLGWFDRVFNSPSNHRVHHAVNAGYLDCNYGGILMVYDHIFRSYRPEDPGEPCRYGLVGGKVSYNPLRIVFSEWLATLRDLRGARGLGDAAGFLVGAPGWRPGGAGATTARLREHHIRVSRGT